MNDVATESRDNETRLYDKTVSLSLGILQCIPPST